LSLFFARIFALYLTTLGFADGKRVLAGTSDGHLQQQPILDIMIEILDEAKASAEAKSSADLQPSFEAKAAAGGKSAAE
jgi:hypothetical protein